MHPTAGPRRLMISGLGLIVAGAAIWFWWPAKDHEPESGVVSNPAVKRVTAGSAGAMNHPPDFSMLPPRERIGAETKHRVEAAAAWREKLRNGNQTTLPAEAYPPGVPPHPPATPPQ